MKKLLKIPIYIAIVFTVIILAIVYLYSFTTLPENELNNWLVLFAPKKLGLEIKFDKINRDFWNHIVIDGLEISRSDDDQARLAYISHLEVKYKISDIIKGKYIISSFRIDSLQAWIPKSGTIGNQSGTSQSSQPFNSSITVDTVSVNLAQITLPNSETISMDTLYSKLVVDKGKFDISIDRFRADWPERNFGIDSLHGRIVSNDNGFNIVAMKVITKRSDLTLSGQVGKSITSGWKLDYIFSPIDLKDIESLTKVKINGVLESNGTISGSIKDFGGKTVVNGIFMAKPFDEVYINYHFANGILGFDKIDGDVFHSRFNGAGQIDFTRKPEHYSYNGSINHLDLRGIGPALKTDFTGNVRMEGQGFTEDKFHMAIDAQLQAVKIDSFYFDEVAGSVDFNLKNIEFLPGFSARYKNTYINATGNLEYQGNLDIAGEVVFKDLRDFTGQTFIQILGGKGKATVHATGPTIDFNADASFNSDSCWTYGLIPGFVHIDANLKSFISHKVGVVKGYWKGGTLYSVPSDTGYFKAGVSGERAFLDTVYIANSYSNLRLNGGFNGTIVPPTFVVDTLFGEIHGNHFFSRSPIEFSLFPKETEFDQFKLGYETGTISISGTVTNDLDLGLDIQATGFQIQPIIKQIYKDKAISGIWSGTALLRGNFDKPIMDFDLRIDSLTIGQTNMGNLIVRSIYEDGYLYSDSSYMYSPSDSFYFYGKFPIDLSFAESANRFPENPIDFNFSASGKRLTLAEIFIPDVQRFDADFNVKINYGGTYANPKISGAGQISNGQLTVVELQNLITGIRANLRMENATIYLDSLVAGSSQASMDLGGALNELISGRSHVSDKSGLAMSGVIKLLGLGKLSYDLNIGGRNYYFVSSLFGVSGFADLDLKVKGDIIPTVSGKIQLRRLDVREEFEKFTGKDYNPEIVLEDSTIWNLNIDVSCVNNLWIQNSNIDAELKGDVLVERNLGIMKMLGQFNVIRGAYTLFGQKFQVISGALNFQNVATVNPDLDFTVTTRLRNAPGAGQGPMYSDVQIHISGTLKEPKIDMGSQSTLTREDFFKMLVSGNEISTLFPGQQQQSSFAINILKNVGLLSAFVPNPLTGQGIVEEFSIYPTQVGDPQISLAKYISRSLYLRYSRTLSRESGTAIGVEYYLNNNLSFQATQNLRGTQDEGISFDINFNYEY